MVALLAPRSLAYVAVIVSLRAFVGAQTFQRLGTCPTLGCIFPPDRAEFLPGVHFDVRLEVHAPVNGTEAFNQGVPDNNFTLVIGKLGETPVPAATFFNTLQSPALEHWNFTWYEDLYAQDAHAPSLVNVASKAYRYVSINSPGEYVATLRYYNGTNTTAHWTVLQPEVPQKKAKNVILFIGDGMTTNMITAARLIGHKSINGKYLTKMAMDSFQHLGHQMTHSIDSFITDSANSATALYTGHKSTVNALGVYRDSSPSIYDDPKVETIAELFKSRRSGQVGIVSTAFLADATPGALTAHTPDRDMYGTVVESFLYGVTRNYTWTPWSGPDVLFGAGAENFLVGGSFSNASFYSQFQAQGYSLALNQTSLQTISNRTRALGVFCKSNLNKWLDRNVYKSNLVGQKNDPAGGSGDALDQPGLQNMTIKAIDILHARDVAANNTGFFLMSEAASIDKMMHVLDYDRALGELLELDATITATMRHLDQLGILNDTLIITTADHGHGFDVFGSADTKYLADQTTDRQKRRAIGTYQNSGLSQYIASDMSGIPGFPTQWDPRYTLAQGFGAHPDVREDYAVKKNVTGGARLPAVPAANGSSDYVVNPVDSPKGFIVNGTLPTTAAQGVHSLTDVPVFASGPGSELFAGVYNSVDIFFKMAAAMELI